MFITRESNCYSSNARLRVRQALCCGVSLLILIGSVGCATFNMDELQMPQLPETNLTTTGVGAVGGAVVGAGLGLLVGSATGNAGEGFLVGSLAGATTGGLIGRGFENHERALLEQDEVLRRQEESIHQQQREIEELKRGSSDGVGPQRTGRKAWSLSRSDAPGADLPSSKQVAPDEVDLGSGVDYEVNSRVPEMKLPAARVSKMTVEDSREPISHGRASKTSADSAGSKERARLLDSLAEDLPPARKNIEQEEASKADSMVLDSPSGSFAPNDSDCKSAKAEADRASSTDSDADKLFYLRRAIRLCPKQIGYHMEIAKVYLNIGRVEDAEYEFRQVLEIEPGNAEAKKQLSSLE